jgi:epoxyqueuosine reductase
MILSDELLAFALEAGFQAAAIVPVSAPIHADAFSRWLDAGYQGAMAYLTAHAALRLDPTALAPDARSMLVALAAYHPGPPPAGWNDPARGRIARYAWSRDYHADLKARMFRVDAFLRERTGRAALGRACVDTAPVLERDLAEGAGLGFTGRNTCLITPRSGSWNFIATLFVPEVLAPAMRHSAMRTESLPVVATCGRCTRCLDRCPTAAFPTPYVLDARRCISYLTIELRGPIPRDLRAAMGNWVFGCDICQEVCPYNRAVPLPASLGESPDIDRVAPRLLDLLALDEAAFRTRFRGTAILRAKRRGLVRNACVAAGNSGDADFIPALEQLLADAEPLVRGHAAWALGRLGGAASWHALAAALRTEPDAMVNDELAAALKDA